MPEPRAFWLDEQFDREHGTDGRGRYEAEVLRRIGEFDETWGDFAPVSFAATAWQVATALSPGFVRWHRRIISATCARSPWDGSMVCAVTVVSGWPAELTWTKQWQRDRGWRDWPQLFGQFTTPTDQDQTRSPHLRALLQVDARRFRSTTCRRHPTDRTTASPPPRVGRSWCWPGTSTTSWRR
ncbi:hypothetical protein O7614_16660 [Micromonospora sp. WMMD961]|uniref:hypothetical protein n=1 Tax=Micromonospora sp. WMMD961 TaxID=3016100 RepID=UPI002417BF59|nr:hypothetical protein [Micromonospora sp. WMMD961]MDG4781283.1 hypothetical protein [Micromonospora sp. WMMD961]